MHEILTGDAAEGDGASLAGVGQVIEAGGKIGVADESAGRGAGEVREGNGGAASIGSIDAEDGCITTGAREQLGRAIENVVRNAIRYTEAGTHVSITVRKQSASEVSRVVVQVSDHGPGVASEHLEKIFLPFYRVAAVNGEPAGGAGLGLAISERIVRMHGGRVHAANATDGGLVVQLELPLSE